MLCLRRKQNLIYIMEARVTNLRKQVIGYESSSEQDRNDITVAGDQMVDSGSYINSNREHSTIKRLTLGMVYANIPSGWS